MNSPDKTSKIGSISNDYNSLGNRQNPISNPPIISSVSEFLVHINKIIKPDTAKGSKFLFRGQENKKWKIETSTYRRLKKESKHKSVSEEHELYYNIRLIEQFKQGDFHSGYSSEIMKLDLGILAQLQHLGAATSLIDFSDNPLVALLFACKTSSESDSNDGKVFILSTDDELKFEEINSFEQIEEYKVNIPDQLDNPQVDGILNNSIFFYWKPTHLNNRITAQQSYFLISKRELPKMQEIIIKGDLKANILKDLSLVYGVNEMTLFPDLVGFAQANSVHSASDKETQNFIYKKIIFRIDKIIKGEPKNYDAYNKRGIAKYNLGNYKSAINDFNQAIKIKANNAILYSNRGYAKYRLNDYEGTINDYNKATKIEPNNASYYNNCGSAKHKLENYEDAINDYNKAIKIEQDTALFYGKRAAAKYALVKAKIELEDYLGGIDYCQDAINDYKAELKLNQDKNLIEGIIKDLKQAEEMLKNLHSKLPANKK